MIREYPDIEEEGDQVADGDALKGNKKTAGKDDIHLDQCGEKAHACLKAAHIMIAVFLGREKTVIPLLELLIFHLFIGKGFYYPDSREIIFNLGIDLSYFLPISAEGPSHFAVEKEGKEEHKRQYDEGCQYKPAIDAHQYDKSPCDLQYREYDIFRTMMKELRNIK